MNPFESIETQSQHWSLQEDGIDIEYRGGFLSSEAADRLFEALKSEVSWRRHVINTPAGPKTVPRMISWHADEGLTYSYSGITHPWQPWAPAMLEIRAALEKELKTPFNGCLANFYENERDSVSPHADDEEDMQEGAPVVSVSLGETREFVVKHMTTGARHVIPLEHGSLLIMRGDTQKVSRHSIPKARKVCGPRINLTFRQILSPEREG